MKPIFSVIFCLVNFYAQCQDNLHSVLKSDSILFESEHNTKSLVFNNFLFCLGQKSLTAINLKTKEIKQKHLPIDLVKNGFYAENFWVDKLNKKIRFKESVPALYPGQDIVEPNEYFIDIGLSEDFHIQPKLNDINKNMPQNKVYYDIPDFIQERTKYYCYNHICIAVGKTSYYIDLNTKNSFLLDLTLSKEVKEIFLQDDLLLVFLEDKILKYSVSNLLENKVELNVFTYQDQKNNYEKEVSNMMAQKYLDFSEYLNQVKFIGKLYKKEIEELGLTNHLQISVENLNSENFQNGFIRFLMEDRLDTTFLSNNLSNILDRLIRNGKFDLCIKIDGYVQAYYPTLRHKIDGRIPYTLDSIRSYQLYVASLYDKNYKQDTLELLKILGLNKVCHSGVFCHEGCGGCDYSLMVSGLKSYKTKFRNYKDIVDYHLLNLEYSYPGEEFNENDRLKYKKFIDKYPTSKYTISALLWLVEYDRNLYQNFDDLTVKNRLLKNINDLISKSTNFDEYENIKYLQNYLNEK